METIKLTAHIDDDGILKLEVPTGLAAREVEVVLVFNALAAEPAQEDWTAFVNRMYGALAHDPIERPPQLPLEERDVIE